MIGLAAKRKWAPGAAAMAAALALLLFALPATASADATVGVQEAQREVEKAQLLVDRAVDAADAGERERGYDLARSAYLDHFELVEIPLRLRNPNLVLDLECHSRLSLPASGAFAAATPPSCQPFKTAARRRISLSFA